MIGHGARITQRALDLFPVFLAFMNKIITNILVLFDGHTHFLLDWEPDVGLCSCVLIYLNGAMFYISVQNLEISHKIELSSFS